jgi:hypothetical protein
VFPFLARQTGTRGPPASGLSTAFHGKAHAGDVHANVEAAAARRASRSLGWRKRFARHGLAFCVFRAGSCADRSQPSVGSIGRDDRSRSPTSFARRPSGRPCLGASPVQPNSQLNIAPLRQVDAFLAGGARLMPKSLRACLRNLRRKMPRTDKSDGRKRAAERASTLLAPKLLFFRRMRTNPDVLERQSGAGKASH